MVLITLEDSGFRFDGHSAAVEGGEAWVVRYAISLDEHWITKSAHIWGWSTSGVHEVRLDSNGSGQWQIDGSPAPEYDGCFDIDLESSSCTNTIPVHRLRLAVGQSADAPATFVRAIDLGIERLEQRYLRGG